MLVTFLFLWRFVTWPWPFQVWPFYSCIIILRHLPALCVSLTFAARLTDPTVQNVKCFLPLTLPLTLMLNIYYVCLDECFERRLSCLVTTLSFRDNLGVGEKRPPPCQWCLAETLFNTGLNGGSRESGKERGHWKQSMHRQGGKYPHFHVLRSNITRDTCAPAINL